MTPSVLVSDKLSKTAVRIFRDRGVNVDYEPDLGRDQDAMLAVIPLYDGLAIRSATKVSPTLIAAAQNLKVIGRAGIGVDNIDIPAATSRGIVVMNTPCGNAVTTAEHALSVLVALARQVPEPMRRATPSPRYGALLRLSMLAIAPVLAIHESCALS